jgi:8-oxo-dGTP pyrophosphatase MutT (NUDIX family)
MLLFYAADDGTDLDAVQHHGLSSPPDCPLQLYASLDAAKRAGTGPVLAIDPSMLPEPPEPDDTTVRVSRVPSSAVQNLAPYRPPSAVTAAGGYVARPLSDEDVALLLIHRRGVWDLPKGHRDPGEDLDACAQREVREEVGIDTLRLLRDLGTTQHGYPYGDIYAVKTTYWYLMRTPERTFEPDRREGIQRVAWARWAVAHRHVGYDTLRRHMDRVEPEVRTTFS